MIWGVPAPAYHLVRSVPSASVPPVLDAAQRAVLEHVGGPLRVLAGPGTGKTTTLVEAVVDRVENRRVPSENVLVLTFSRRAAAALRARICARLGRTTRDPVAMTFHSYAFALLRYDSVLRGEPAPRLLTSPEQDLTVRDLLRGHRGLEAAGRSRVAWPEDLVPALGTRGFATQLRDLLLRATERGISPRELSELGRMHRRPAWVAAGDFFAEYQQVTALRSPVPAYDPAELVAAACELLAGDPELLERERRARRVVLVDEYQDADPAQERLLALLAGDGRDVVVVGDPDQAIYGFRGSDPDVLNRFPERFLDTAGTPAATVALTSSRRLPTSVLTASRRVAARLGGTGAHRVLEPAVPSTGPSTGPSTVPSARTPPPEGSVELQIHPTHTQEAAAIAAAMRRAHLVDGLAWQEMAVLVRSSNQLGVLRRALRAADVPVSVEVNQVPFTDEPAVRPFLAALQVVVGRSGLTADRAVELVTSALGGADALTLRRLRQAMRAGPESSVAGSEGGSEGTGATDAAMAVTGETIALGPLLLAAISDPSLVAPPMPPRLSAPVTRVAAVLRAGREALDIAGATAESVLWAMWDASDLSDRWAMRAVGGTTGAAEADRGLDAMLALFDAATRFVDRLPAAGPEVFLDHVLGQQFPADTLVPAAPDTDAVVLLTAHAAKGLEWDLVAVAGVNEGVWPDLRLSGSVLGGGPLTETLSGVAETPGALVSAQLAEERRLFYVAITRPRQRLLVSGVSNDDTAPSRFLDDLPGEWGCPLPSLTEPGTGSAGTGALDPSSVTAYLRSVVCDESREPGEVSAAATQLARLAAAGVTGADPDDWYGLPVLSDNRPLIASGDPVVVSPSKVESLQQCPLKVVLEDNVGATRPSVRQSVGNLVHDLADEVASKVLTADDLLPALDERWPAVGAGEGWIDAAEHAKARGIVERLRRYLDDAPQRDVVGTELTFTVTIDPVVVRGRVDRLERSGDSLVVIDLKTGSTMPSKEDIKAHPQLAVYQAAVEAGAFEEQTGSRTSGGAELVQLGNERDRGVRVDTQAPISDEDGGRERARDLLTDVGRVLSGSQFPARINLRCRVCSMRPCCPLQPGGKQVLP